MTEKMAREIAREIAKAFDADMHRVSADGEELALLAYNKGRADMREEAANKLMNLDRSGREGVWHSLWASIFRDGIAAIRAIPVGEG